MRLENYVAIDHRRASGIGEATARLFVERGAKVVIADLDEERGRKIESELAPNAVFCKVDVSKSEQVEKMFRMTEEKFGVLDVLFNNAAYSLSKTLWDDDGRGLGSGNDGEFERIFLCRKICAPTIEEKFPWSDCMYRK